MRRVPIPKEGAAISLRLILGRAGSGKTTVCLNEMIHMQQDDPTGPPVFYLVPEQMTFQSEMKLLRSGVPGLFRVQVVSFSRLAWRVLQETGGMARPYVGRTGIQMLLRKIVEQEKHRLRLYAGAVDMAGFIARLEEMMTELRRYAVTPEVLQAQRKKLLAKTDVRAQERVLADKLHDLALVLEGLENALAVRYADSEDMLRRLAERVPESSLLKRAHVYMDGFHSLTPQELAVVRQLLATARRVTVALTLDRAPDDEAPLDPLHLFYETARTYRHMRRLAADVGCPVEDDVCLAGGKRFASPELAHLERVYGVVPAVPFRLSENEAACPACEPEDEAAGQAGEPEGAGRQSRRNLPNPERPAVRLLQAVNRRAEVEGVAREIVRLVRDGGYRYRDVAVLVRNSDDYHDLLATVFADYGVPVFMDRKRSMLNHPLIELLRSALETFATRWRYEAVFRCLKTELLFPLSAFRQDQRLRWREAVDRLENFVLAHGIQGRRWFSDETWQRPGTAFAGEGVEPLAVPSTAGASAADGPDNRAATGGGPTAGDSASSGDGSAGRKAVPEQHFVKLRTHLLEPLRRWQVRLEQAVTVGEKCAVLYQFLEEQQIPDKLRHLQEAALGDGDLEGAQEHEQVWNAVVELLDQMVELLGDETMPLELFRQTLETGLESLQFSLIPPALDQVVVAQVERSRLSDVKCTFVLGANEGILPARPPEDGMLAEEEREWLLQQGVELAPGSRQRLLDEQFLLYMALTRASERLVVSYPLADEEGHALQPSVLVRQLKEWFPGLQEQLWVSAPQEAPPEQQAEFVARPGPALSLLTARLQEWRRGYPLEPVWWAVYNWATTHPQWADRTRRLLASLFHRNEARRLAPEQSRRLYGQHVELSVSRMERFQACPFRHFAAYGLRLRERPLFRLEAPDIGQLFHVALKTMTERLREQGSDWRQVSPDECRHLAAETVEQLAPTVGREILLSSNRYGYMKRKLTRIVQQAAVILSEHAKVSGFAPVGLEVDFGRGRTLPPLTVSLPDGGTVEVAGRIDRVDKATVNDKTYVRIIDYKSSRQELRLDEFYHGLSWQMMVYLDVVLRAAPHWLGEAAHPAGVLYFHVHDPIIRSEKALSDEELATALLKQFRMQGLLLNNAAVVRWMDQSLEKGYSRIVPVGISKDGTLYKDSKVIDDDDFALLRRFLQAEMARLSQQLMSGVIDIAPYRFRDETACDYCPYRAVCQFDPLLGGNEFRVLKREKAEVMLERIRYAVGAGEGSEEADHGTREGV